MMILGMFLLVIGAVALDLQVGALREMKRERSENKEVEVIELKQWKQLK